jgi:hypothetical protein
MKKKEKLIEEKRETMFRRLGNSRILHVEPPVKGKPQERNCFPVPLITLHGTVSQFL